MALVDQIIGVESGGNSDAESSSNVPKKFFTNSLVRELLFSASPSAILWRVISVYVDAINRMSLGWLLAHVGKEIFETVSPLLANFNTPRSVPLVGNMPLVLASSDHAAPRVIFGRRAPSARNRNRLAVGGIGFFGGLDLPAPATLCIAGPQIRHGNCDGVSAVTLAHIATNSCAAVFSDLGVRFAKGGKAAEPFSCAIKGDCH